MRTNCFLSILFSALLSNLILNLSIARDIFHHSSHQQEENNNELPNGNRHGHHHSHRHHHIANQTAIAQNKYNFNITLLFVLYYDVDLVMDILLLNKPFVSEIVVVDGPRKQSEELLSSLDLLYTEDSSVVRQFFDKTVRAAFPDLNYHYRFGVWPDEEVQRQAGYDACTNDLVFIADGDMLVKLDPKTISRFAHSKHHGVGKVQVWNMVSSNIFFSGTNDSAFVNKPIYQPVAANRKVVDARTFFDHLWIVGVKQRHISGKLMFPESLGEAHHYTIGRTPISMMIKYAFYLTVPGNYEHFIVKNNFINRTISIHKIHGIDVARNIFLRSVFEAGTCLSNHYLYPTPIQVQKMFPAIITGDSFPGFSLPYGQALLCNFTFLSGGTTYHGTNEESKELRYPVIGGVESFIALNHKQTLQGQVCLKLENVDFCRARVLHLALHSKGRQLYVAETREATFRIQLHNATTFDESQFVRYVLAISCNVKTAVGNNDLSSVGWYQETICDAQ